jgi:hypothetical protein
MNLKQECRPGIGIAPRGECGRERGAQRSVLVSGVPAVDVLLADLADKRAAPQRGAHSGGAGAIRSARRLDAACRRAFAATQPEYNENPWNSRREPGDEVHAA